MWKTSQLCVCDVWRKLKISQYLDHSACFNVKYGDMVPSAGRMCVLQQKAVDLLFSAPADCKGTGEN